MQSSTRWYEAARLTPSSVLEGLVRRTGDRRERLRGIVDRRRLEDTVRGLPTESDLAAASVDLRMAYESYVSEVSSPGWAVSFETSCVLLALCRASKVTSALDLGSGFSSYVLRLWATEQGATVASVDDAPNWLASTSGFLEKHGLEASRLTLWDDRPSEEFDLVFHDFASGRRREEAMAYALAHSRRFVIFDDAQHAGHRRAMERVCKEAGVDLFSLSSLTMDEKRRFAMMAVL